MLITLDDHRLVEDLCAHYTRSGFGAEPVGGGMIDVTHPNAVNEADCRRDVTMHLLVWRVANPGVAVRPAS